MEQAGQCFGEALGKVQRYFVIFKILGKNEPQNSDCDRLEIGPETEPRPDLVMRDLYQVELKEKE